MTTNTDSRSQSERLTDGGRETDETDTETLASEDVRPDCRSLHVESV
jgi:hypothetical protein